MAIEHHGNFSYNGSRTGVTGQSTEIELLEWSGTSKIAASGSSGIYLALPPTPVNQLWW
jgi:hypothetical protein